MPRAAVAVGCHGHLPVGSGRWVNEASWGQPRWLVGAGTCISNSLAHEELMVSQRARLGRRCRLQGSEEGLAGKLSREVTVLPPGHGCSGQP